MRTVDEIQEEIECNQLKIDSLENTLRVESMLDHAFGIPISKYTREILNEINFLEVYGEDLERELSEAYTIRLRNYYDS